MGRLRGMQGRSLLYESVGGTPGLPPAGWAAWADVCLKRAAPPHGAGALQAQRTPRIHSSSATAASFCAGVRPWGVRRLEAWRMAPEGSGSLRDHRVELGGDLEAIVLVVRRVVDQLVPQHAERRPGGAAEEVRLGVVRKAEGRHRAHRVPEGEVEAHQHVFRVGLLPRSSPP